MEFHSPTQAQVHQPKSLYHSNSSYMAMKSASAGAAILDSALTQTEGGWEVEISIRAQTLIAISTPSLPPNTLLGL
jgi:hypothetical protein